MKRITYKKRLKEQVQIHKAAEFESSQIANDLVMQNQELREKIRIKSMVNKALVEDGIKNLLELKGLEKRQKSFLYRAKKLLFGV